MGNERQVAGCGTDAIAVREDEEVGGLRIEFGKRALGWQLVEWLCNAPSSQHLQHQTNEGVAVPLPRQAALWRAQLAQPGLQARTRSVIQFMTIEKCKMKE